jgi:hypothetical protein
MFLDDLEIGDRKFDFAADPKWESIGSHVKFQEHDIVSDQNFGFSPTTFAGGESGEIGGTIWHSARPVAWYADRIGPLDLSQPLHASGKITLQVGAPDSGALLGWFNTNNKDAPLKETRNFLGAHIEGPTRVGHYFSPRFNASDGTRREPDHAAVLPPDGKPHAFAIDYDPQTAELRTTLDGKTTTTTLRGSDLKAGATFDRFGLLSMRRGGQKVILWVDDLTYTSRRAED